MAYLRIRRFPRKFGGEGVSVALVESFRENGYPKSRTLANLGRHENIEDAIKAFQGRIDANQRDLDAWLGRWDDYLAANPKTWFSGRVYVRDLPGSEQEVMAVTVFEEEVDRQFYAIERDLENLHKLEKAVQKYESTDGTGCK